MKTPLRWTALLALTSAVALVAADLKSSGEGDEARRAAMARIEGKPAPELQVTHWLNGSSVTLADLKGKIVVLDFWATWCGPCIASIPHNNALAEKYKDKVVFIGVCHPRGGEKMAETVTAKGLKYLTARDSTGATIKAYNVDGYPDYYIIDAKGILRVADCANSKVENTIELLLKVQNSTNKAGAL